MSLRPDQSHQQLSASITIVASYQKKPETKPASTPSPEKAVASAKPVANPKPAAPEAQASGKHQPA